MATESYEPSLPLSTWSSQRVLAMTSPRCCLHNTKQLTTSHITHTSFPNQTVNQTFSSLFPCVCYNLHSTIPYTFRNFFFFFSLFKILSKQKRKSLHINLICIKDQKDQGTTETLISAWRKLWAFTNKIQNNLVFSFQAIMPFFSLLTTFSHNNYVCIPLIFDRLHLSSRKLWWYYKAAESPFTHANIYMI